MKKFVFAFIFSLFLILPLNTASARWIDLGGEVNGCRYLCADHLVKPVYVSDTLDTSGETKAVYYEYVQWFSMGNSIKFSCIMRKDADDNLYKKVISADKTLNKHKTTVYTDNASWQKVDPADRIDGMALSIIERAGYKMIIE